MNLYKTTIYCIFAFVIGYALCAWKENKKHEDIQDYKITIENLYHAHINDSLWNEQLQDSLDKRIIEKDSILIPKIKHHYEKIYIGIDTISVDSSILLLHDLLRYYEDKIRHHDTEIRALESKGNQYRDKSRVLLFGI